MGDAIHPSIIGDFKGQSYLACHNGELTLPDGQTGNGNRRFGTIDYPRRPACAERMISSRRNSMPVQICSSG